MAIGHFLVRLQRRSLFMDILCGAAGGAFGTFCMNQASKLASKFQKRQGQGQESQQEQEPATVKLARKVLEPAGVQLEGDRKKKAGQAVHWGYGTLWGALYGAMHGRVPYVGRLFGLGFGLGLFLLSDELMVPALRLSPPPNEVPLPVHLRAFAAHLAYGSAAEGSFRLLRRVLV